MYLVEAMKTAVNTGLLNTMVSAPAIVESFDPKLQTIKANIAIMRIIDGVNSPYTLLIDIPILLPTVQGFHLTMPIKAGDEVLVLFADRCIDNWFIDGGVQSQAEHRIHDISDGFAIIGVNSTPNVITDYDPENMVIRNTANTQKITLMADGNIEIDTTKDIKMKCVNLDVDCTRATVKAKSKVTLDTPSTEITGKLDVTGAITSAVSVTAPSIVGSASVASPSILAGGVEMKDHLHGGVTTGSGNTAPVA